MQSLIRSSSYETRVTTRCVYIYIQSGPRERERTCVEAQFVGEEENSIGPAFSPHISFVTFLSLPPYHTGEEEEEYSPRIFRRHKKEMLSLSW